MGISDLLAGETTLDEILDVGGDLLAQVIPNDPDRLGTGEHFGLMERVGQAINGLVDILPEGLVDRATSAVFNMATSAPEAMEAFQGFVSRLTGNDLATDAPEGPDIATPGMSGS